MQDYLAGTGREKLDPILDGCVALYLENLDEDGQVDFKGKAKAFLRTYGFLSAILPYTNAEWEKLSIFLNFLVPKLPAPKEEDLSKGILETIDMDSYRVEKKAAIKIQLPDQDVEIEPVPLDAGGGRAEPELDRLSNILKAFNDQFGGVVWSDRDRVRKLVTEEIPAKVAADKAYQNARKNSDKQNAKIEHDKALKRVMTAVLKDDAELYKQFSDNPEFRRWMTDAIFSMTYEEGGAGRPISLTAGILAILPIWQNLTPLDERPHAERKLRQSLIFVDLHCREPLRRGSGSGTEVIRRLAH